MGEKDLRKGVSLLICFRDWMWSKHVLSLRSLDPPAPGPGDRPEPPGAGPVWKTELEELPLGNFKSVSS